MHLIKLCRAIRLHIVGQRITIRRSSQFRKSTTLKKDQLAEIRETHFLNRTELTPKQWQELTTVLVDKYKHINTKNVDAIIVGVCHDSQQLRLASNYIDFLEANGKTPNDAALGKLMRIFNVVYHKRGGGEDALSDQDQCKILSIYQKIRGKHELLDSISCENLIHGIICTKKWKDALELLEMMKVTATPSLSAFNEITIKAFRMRDLSLGWRLLQDMLEQRKQPKCEVYLEYLRAIPLETQTLRGEIEKFFLFLKMYDVVITEKVANALVDIVDKQTSNMALSFTKLKRHGKCITCNQHLENVSVSNEEFEKLRSEFLDKVLIRNDIFQRSTPEEVEHFRKYVSKTGPYDCVIDGLNVAYSRGSKKPAHALANLLANVVKYFRKKNKHVLVLGRKHMNNWPHTTMRYIRDNAAIFLANDMSQDDPFLLYATLHSGPATDFFSRDFMRQHAFLLGPELKAIFRRWQQEHQYALVTQTDDGKIVVKEPIRHLISAHKVGSYWHVPYKMEYTLHQSDSFNVPEHWLCVNSECK